MRVALALIVSALSLFNPTLGKADNTDDAWSSFRNAFPNHFQTLALSRPSITGVRTLVISEPPPDTLPKRKYKEQLTAIFRKHLIDIRLKRQEMALHGWGEDIVITLTGYDGDSGELQLRDDVAYLAQTIWGTTYKAAPLALPIATGPTPWSAPPNLSLRHTELRDWLVDGKLKLVPVELPAATPNGLAQLVNANRTGAFMTAGQRGLVVLIIDRGRHFEEFRADFRKFALDADVVLGTIRFGDRHLAIVGREREASLTAMPPLRFETAQLLVTTPEPELAQSYERNHLFAGRLTDGNFKNADWAPIYLSPELVNTELGSTLNITDQMLKSWSSAGLVSYHGFKYPRPTHFPFGGKAISEEVSRIESKITETLFNWNTTGAFSLLTYVPAGSAQRIQLLSGLNSGSLPLIYKDESQPAFDQIFVPFEDKGYEYFRTLRDPLLTRVTSYQMMFQATRDRPLPSATPTRRVTVKPPAAVRSKVVELLQQSPDLSKLDDQKLERFCNLALTIGEVATADECKRAVAFSAVSGIVYKSGSEALRGALVDFSLDRNLGRGISVAEMKRAIEAIDKLIEGEVNPIPRELERAVAQIAARYFIQGSRVLRQVDDDDRLAVFKLYSADQSEDPDSYIRTPLVVVSRNGFSAVGGHNLNGKTTAIEADAKLPRGTVRLDQKDGQDVIVLNPGDVDNAGPAARAHARQAAGGADRGKLQTQLQKLLADRMPPRDLRAALAFDRPNDAARGLVIPARAETGSPQLLGFYAAEPNAARLQQSLMLAKELDLTVVVLKFNNEFIVLCVYCASGQEIRALSQAALRESVLTAMNQAPQGAERRIFFQNFARDEVDAFQTTMEFGQGPPPPLPPGPRIAAAGEEPPWRGGNTGGGGGNNAGGGGRGGGNTPGGPGNPKLLFLRSADAQRGHGFEVRMKEGGKFRDPSLAEIKEVSRQLDQTANWSRATVEPTKTVPILPGEKPSNFQAFEMMVPERGETSSLEFRVRWREAPSTAEQQGTLTEARAQLLQMQGSYRQGIERLIDRLRSLRINRNAVADVRFFFTRTVFDAIITKDLSSSHLAPGG